MPLGRRTSGSAWTASRTRWVVAYRWPAYARRGAAGCRSETPGQLWLVSSAEGAREAEVRRHRVLEPGDLTDPSAGEADHLDPGEVE